MTIESANYLNGLDEVRPLNTDLVAEGDDHLRLLKRVLKDTFPGRGLAEKAPIAKTISFVPGVAEVSALFLAKGATQATLPAVSGLAPGTHYWFWAEDNNLLLTTADSALINGSATVALGQGTGVCALCTGVGWVTVGLGGGGGIPLNFIAGAGIDIVDATPDITISATTEPLNANAVSPLVISGTYPDLDWEIDPQPSAVFRTTKTDNQLLTDSVSKFRVAWNNATYDTEGGLTTFSDSYEVFTAGYYQINTVISFSRHVGVYRAEVYIHVGSTEMERAFCLIPADDGSLTNESVSLAGIVYADVGNFITIHVRGRTSSVYVIGTESSFSGHFIPLGLY